MSTRLRLGNCNGFRGLSETDVEKVIQGRPYKQKDDLVTREIITEGTYVKIKDLIMVE